MKLLRNIVYSISMKREREREEKEGKGKGEREAGNKENKDETTLP